MANLPAQDILSLVMNHGYQSKDSEGRAVVCYYLSPDLEDHAVNLVQQEGLGALPKMDLISFPEVDIEQLCESYKISNFGVYDEKEFFVKSAHSKNHHELEEVRTLAVEDHIRYGLYHNLINSTTCPALKESFNFLNLTESSFYQKFLYDTTFLGQLLMQQRPDLNIRQSVLKKMEDSIEKSREQESANDRYDAIEASHLINKSLKAISDNSNLIFEKVEHVSEAELYIYLDPSPDSVAGELLQYEGDKIIFLMLSAASPLGISSNSSAAWNTFIHGIAHGFLDHACENGFYACDKMEVENLYSPFALRTVLFQGSALTISSDAASYTAQSFLPWDWAALRYKYGMPTAKNMTYKLNDTDALADVFGYKLIDHALVSFPNVGHSIIDACGVKDYSIDLGQDKPSIIENHEIKFAFILSYDTEISELKLSTGGRITLSDKFDTKLILSGNYNIVIHNDASEATTISCVETEGEPLGYCAEEAGYQVDVYNFDTSHHHIIQE